MGCVCATAKRRRSQARNGYRHLHKTQRPVYSKVDKETSQKRLRRLIETERRIKTKGG